MDTPPGRPLTGPLLAVEPFIAGLFGLPAGDFHVLFRLFVVSRLAVVPPGPGAELLESGGLHEHRCRLVLRTALPLAFLGCALAFLGHHAAVAVAIGPGLLEVLQSLAVRTRLGFDCSVFALLRRVPQPVS